MDWKQIQDISLAVVGLITLFVLIFAGAVLFVTWSKLEPSQRASVATAGIQAVGTLFLAVATFWTVRHGARRMKERERENEKPLARNEAVHLIQPALNALSHNIHCLEQDYEVDWFHYDPSKQFSLPIEGIYAAGDPSPVISTKDPHALVRLEQERPDLYQRLQEHDEMLQDLATRADQIAEQIDSQLQQFLTKNDLDSEFSDESDVQTLKSAIIKEIDQYGETHEHYDIWDKYREDFLEILHSNAEQEFKDFQSVKGLYQEHCESLLEDLRERKIELQEEYGFVVEDKTEELENTVGGRVT